LSCFRSWHSTPGRKRSTNYVTAVIRFTNGTVYGNSITVNGQTRTFTNANTTTGILTNSTANGSATNLFNALAGVKLPAPIPFLAQTNTNTITLYGRGLSASLGGSYAILTLVTNTGTNGWDPKLPYDLLDPQSRTNNASEFVYGLKYSSNSVATGTVAMANFPDKTSAGTIGNKRGTNWTLADSTLTNVTPAKLTGGYWTNGRADNLTTTNLVNHGNAFSSPGTGINSEQFGNGASATGDNDTAVGPFASASGTNSLAAGTSASSSGINSTAVGVTADAQGPNSTAVGSGAAVSGASGTAIGASALVAHDNSTAIGTGAQTTTSNQVMLGTSTIDVRVNNILQAGSITNSTFTGTNNWQGDFAQTINRNGAVLSAVNADVQLTNTFVQFGVIGNFTNAGFFHPGMRDGLRVTIENTNGAAMVILNNSGSESVPERRVLTAIGGPAINTNNPGYFELIYRVTSSYTNWVLMNPKP
jgi:hypothetical protein